MSGASEAVEALKAVAQDAYQATFTAGSQFARAHSTLRTKSDIVEVLQATIDALVAVEALHDAADQATKALRAVLAQQMDATGCTTVQASHHAAHLARKPAFLAITDESQIPRDFYIQPPPQLDKRAVVSALKDGTDVGGCSLAIPNEMSLRIVAKKEAS